MNFKGLCQSKHLMSVAINAFRRIKRRIHYSDSCKRRTKLLALILSYMIKMAIRDNYE